MSAQDERRTDVIVIGAGMSGLKAASDLGAQGRSVIVLEANERVGGRLKPATVAGRLCDMGGQWVAPKHTMLLDEARRFGIETYPQYTEGKTVMQLLGGLTQFTGEVPRMPVLALLELLRLQRRWDRDMATVPAESPWTAPRAKEWDAITLDSWIERNVRTKAARAFARLVPRSTWAADASQISYLWFLDALRSNGGLAYLMAVKNGMLDAKFKGGMHQIAARMAEALGDRVVLGAPVRRIVQESNGARVVTDKGEFEARFVVVAIPPGPAQRIQYEPHLPAARDFLEQRMPMGAIIKIIVAYKEPFWRRNGFSGQAATDDDTLGIVMDDIQDIGPPMLLCFMDGPHAIALSALGKQARREKVIASLVRFFGPEASDPIGYDDNDWTTETWTHGYVGHMPPGTMTQFGPALRAPCGRIHWAGTETSTEWAGCIEGALRAGARAAQEITLRHNQ